MAKEYAKHEINYITQYQKKGYTANYHFEKNALIDSISNTAYTPQEVYIVAEHRFEGMSDPSDMSILYVLETSDGSKGTFLLGYGPTADIEIATFFKQIPEKNTLDKENPNQHE